MAPEVGSRLYLFNEQPVHHTCWKRVTTWERTAELVLQSVGMCVQSFSVSNSREQSIRPAPQEHQ